MNIPATINLSSPGTMVAGVRPSAWPMLCRVLLVGNDAESLEHYRDLVENLGYSCDTETDALSALRHLVADAGIGIVMVDLKMEQLDGLFLLNEISERFMALRPLVTIATGETESDLTVDLMRCGASDLLVKPLAVDDLCKSLRRAASRWGRLARQFQATTALALAADSLAAPVQRALNGGGEPSSEELQELGAKIIKSRQSRSNFVESHLLNEATWGILLDLAVAHLKGEHVATSSACAAAQVPLSTALRHVNQLIEAGWVKRVGDPHDKRRTFLELQPHFADLMTNYLKASWYLFGGKSARR